VEDDVEIRQERVWMSHKRDCVHVRLCVLASVWALLLGLLVICPLRFGNLRLDSIGGSG
jgi:hypothetical protein